MKRTHTLLLLIGLAAGAAQAQTPDTTRLERLQDVVVISTPKERGTLRQQPASTTVLDRRQLADLQATALKEAAPLVPNLHLPDYGSRLTSAAYIRGVGSRINTPAVGLYVDNMPMPDKSAYDFRFLDVERIDVLRGPQATLYGRNAMGGLLRVHTRNPFHYQGTDLNLGFATATHGAYASATHYHRPSDRLAFSAGGYYDRSDELFHNSHTRRTAANLRSGGGRMRGIWLPRPNLTLDLQASYDYSDQDGYPYFYEGSLTASEPFPAQVGTIAANRQGGYRRSLLNTGLGLEWRQRRFNLNTMTAYQHLRDRMTMDQDYLPIDYFTLEQRQRIHSLTQEVTLRSKGSGRWQWLNGLSFLYQGMRTLSPVDFYADGMRMLEDNINRMLPSPTAIPAFGAMGFTGMGIDLVGQRLNMDVRNETPSLNAALFHQSTLRLAQGLELTAGLRLDYEHLRLRYHAPTRMPYRFRMTNEINPMMAMNLRGEADVLYHGTLRDNYLRLLPKLALKYEWAPGNNLYASFAMGQRSGGYNVQMFSDLLQGAMRQALTADLKQRVSTYLQLAQALSDGALPQSVVDLVRQKMEENIPSFDRPGATQVRYKPEYALSYEAGVHLTAPEARLSTDLSLFFMDVRDQQIARFAASGLGRQMVNAGRAHSCGIEGQARWRATDALLLTAHYGFTHATFRRHADGTTTTDAQGNTTPTDHRGRRVPYVPRHTVGADAAYTWPLRTRWARTFTLGLNYSGTGPIHWTESNLTGNGSGPARQRHYSLLGARLVFALPKATVQFWGRNLTDTRYRTFYFESLSRAYSQHGTPLQVGVDVRVHL